MTKLLKIAICVAMLVTLAACAATAGQNAGATAKINWELTTTSMSTSRNSTACTAKVLVTVHSTLTMTVRGVDVQLLINGMAQTGVGVPPRDYVPGLPQAWQIMNDVGCNYANYTKKPGGFGGTTYPSLIASIPGIATSQDGLMYYEYTANPCLSPHHVGVIWYSAAGSGAAAKAPGKEYSAYGFTLDLSGSDCDGDCLLNPKAVCIYPNYRLPCPVTGEKGNVMVLVDATTAKDFCAFETGYKWLTWMGDASTPGCPYSDPVSTTTWGQVKRLYH
jgi:hypothetical protein